MRVAKLGAIDLPMAVSLLLGASFCYSAWLTSIVFSAVLGHGPLLVAAASFFPIGVVHGLGVWFGSW
jgi:hypothetical protein